MRILTATLLVGGSVLLAASLVTPAYAQCDCDGVGYGYAGGYGS